MRDEQTKRLLIIDAAMQEPSKKALAYFIELNPNLNGAQWPDALDMLSEGDAHCDILEMAYEDLKPHLPMDSLPYIGLVTLTLIYANRGQAPFMGTIAWWCGKIAGKLETL